MPIDIKTGLPSHKIIGIYRVRSDGDCEFVAAVDREMFHEDGALETVIVAIVATMEEVEGDDARLIGFDATDMIVDIYETGENEEEES